MQHSREAAVWNSVFEDAEDSNGVPRGSIRGTVLIETLPAVFQMHEILYELREHSAGLNCGRWDYIFSFIKTVRAHPDRLLPDRAGVGGTAHSSWITVSSLLHPMIKLLFLTHSTYLLTSANVCEYQSCLWWWMTNDTIQLYFLWIGALNKEYWKVVILVFGKVGRCYFKSWFILQS